MNAPADPAPDARSLSFLIRLWKEPQEDGAGAVRGYLRNLKSGEQHYLGSPEEIGAFLVRQAAARLEERSVDDVSATEAG